MEPPANPEPSPPIPPPVGEEELLALIAALLTELGSQRALDGLGRNSSLERDLGLGSLERVELVARVETRFSRSLPESTIGVAETVDDLLRLATRAPLADRQTPSHRLPARRMSPPTRIPPLHDAKNLAELLQRRAEAEPERTHLFLKEDDRDEIRVSFGGLYRDSLSVAAGLSSLGISHSHTVAIMLPTGYDFFRVFMAIQMLGAVPVPLYPPVAANRLEEYSEKQSAILRNAQATVFVTLEKGRAIAELLRSRAPLVQAVVSVDELSQSGVYPRPVAVEPQATALIQYTSGSTGDPKGVALTHRSLLANLRVIGQVLDVQPDDVGVSWLPLYHDMGLIGAWLMPLYFGIPVSIFSPLGFLSRPESWLWAIHTRRATLSAAPNFAYELTARKVSDESIDALDLSCWRAALNGAEPIAPQTLNRFAERFARCGFDARSMMPVYGLAENSLLLTAPPLRRPPRVVRVDRRAFELDSRAVAASDATRKDSSLEFVSAGVPAPGHEIEVWDEDGVRLPESCEGRLVFRGPSMMSGYYRNPEATAAVMARGFIDSGDRGFILDREVFVTGRAKDLIIRAGRNLVPHDLEQSIYTVDAIRRGAVVAFGVPDEASGTEKLVIVAEVRDKDVLEDRRRRGRIEEEVRDRLLVSHGLPIDELRLVPPRTIPKTSSGKLRRGECRQRFLSNQLSAEGPGVGFYLRLGRASVSAKIRSAARRIAAASYVGWVYLLSLAFALGVWCASFPIRSPDAFRRFVAAATRLYLRLSGIRLSVEGAGVFDGVSEGGISGPIVVVANHASYLDPLPLLAALPLDFAFVVKAESARWPVIGRVIRRLGHLFVDRFDAEASAASTVAMKRLLVQGRSIVIFPEATFSASAGIRPFKLGAFQLASEAGVPLLPVALVGTRRWLRDRHWAPRRGEIRVRFGRPTVPGREFAELAGHRQRVAAEIAELVGEPQLDLVVAGYEPAS